MNKVRKNKKEKAVIIMINFYCLYFMNANIIKQDSLLSNISNISVKIDHNQRDGSGLFNNFLRGNENEMQIQLEALEDNESYNAGSFMEKIMCKPKYNMRIQEPQHTWVTGNNAPGLSEEQDDQSQHSKIQEQPQMQEKILIPKQKLQVEKEEQVLEIKEETVETEAMKKYRLLIQKRLKNETKNIPKNYGKAIISFIQKYEHKVRQVTQTSGVDYDDFISQLKEKKRVINTIADLRHMWMDYRYAKSMRLLSNLFLRKYALHYIFNSRICNYGSHIKYRYRLCEAIKEPFSFKHIKDY